MRKKYLPPNPVRYAPQEAKRQFMQQYVLARASTRPDGLDGSECSRQAEQAWETIEKACAK